MNDRLRERIVDALLSKPVVNNAFRGTVVEAIIANALGAEWEWCSDGWFSHDFENTAGKKVEVKQSAARQVWHEDSSKPSSPRFDIAERAGRYERDGSWVANPGRCADIYVFAWHPVMELELVDHFDEQQWLFYPVRSADLPPQKTISLSRIECLATPTTVDRLKSRIVALL